MGRTSLILAGKDSRKLFHIGRRYIDILESNCIGHKKTLLLEEE